MPDKVVPPTRIGIYVVGRFGGEHYHIEESVSESGTTVTDKPLMLNTVGSPDFHVPPNSAKKYIYFVCRLTVASGGGEAHLVVKDGAGNEKILASNTSAGVGAVKDGLVDISDLGDDLYLYGRLAGDGTNASEVELFRCEVIAVYE